MFIKAVRTGRRTFGDKAADVVSFTTVAGVRLVQREFDTWSSGEHAGDGEYIRITAIDQPPVDPWPNIKPIRIERTGHAG